MPGRGSIGCWRQKIIQMTCRSREEREWKEFIVFKYLGVSETEYLKKVDINNKRCILFVNEPYINVWMKRNLAIKIETLWLFTLWSYCRKNIFFTSIAQVASLIISKHLLFTLFRCFIMQFTWNRIFFFRSSTPRKCSIVISTKRMKENFVFKLCREKCREFIFPSL